MKNLFKVFVISATMLFAHDGFSETNPFDPPEEVDCCAQNIPIDGGLSWLLAAGGVYGVSKLRKNFKK